MRTPDLFEVELDAGRPIRIVRHYPCDWTPYGASRSSDAALGGWLQLADKRTLFTRPLHPYTEALLSAATAPDPKRRRQKKNIVQGDVPSPARPPPGCHFHTRCPYAVADCKVTAPPLREVAAGHHVACLLR